MIKTKGSEMSAPIYSNVIEQVFSMLDQDLNSYVYNAYSELSDHLRYPLGLAVILYFTIMGYSIVQGYVQLSMSVFMKTVIKIGLIYMFAMNWSVFSMYAVAGIQGSAGQIGDWLVNASPIAIPHFAGSGINGALQSVLIEVTRIGAWTWDRGSISNWSPFFAAGCIWFFGLLSLAVAVIEIILAKLMLAILFSLAPLFVGFTLFKPTQSMFDRWLGSICGFALFLIMLPAVITLGLTFVELVVHDQYATQGSTITLVDWVPIMITGILNLLLILKISHYAHAIGGGISSASGANMLASGVGGFIGGTFSSVHFAKSSGGVAQTAFSGLKTGLVKSGNATSSLFNAIRGKLRG